MFAGQALPLVLSTRDDSRFPFKLMNTARVNTVKLIVLEVTSWPIPYDIRYWDGVTMPRQKSLWDLLKRHLSTNTMNVLPPTMFKDLIQGQRDGSVPKGAC